MLHQGIRIGDVTQQARHVRQDDQGFGLAGDRHDRRRAVAVHVDDLAVVAQRRRAQNRRVAVIQEQGEQAGVDALDAACKVVAQHPALAVFNDLDRRLAGAFHAAAVRPAQPDRVHAELLQALHEQLVQLADVGHGEQHQRFAVGVAALHARHRGDETRRLAQCLGQYVRFMAGAVYENHPLTLLREIPHVLAHGVDGNSLAASDLYDKHGTSLLTPLRLHRMQAGEGEASGLIQAEHAIHGLHAVAGSPLDQVIQRRDNNHAPAVRVALESDVAVVGAA